MEPSTIEQKNGGGGNVLAHFQQIVDKFDGCMSESSLYLCLVISE